MPQAAWSSLHRVPCTMAISMTDEPETASLFAVTESRIERRAILSVSGEVDLTTAAELSQAVERSVREGAAEIWLDLTETGFMDSTGVKVLIDTRAEMRANDRRLVLICPEGPTLRVLEVTGLVRELEVHPTLAAAQLAG
jgi:anti-sigma B factor antagonist